MIVRWFHKDAFYINLCLIYSGFLLLLEMPLNSQNNILVLVNLYLSLYLYLSAHSHYALPEQNDYYQCKFKGRDVMQVWVA